uniref:Uncharacterized protein n=1 Tax=Prymnesium polylepis TaxID=72548 RepID=A0A7S4IKY5_9EUKA
MHQSAAPDSPCTVCSDYTPQGAQLGTYQQPWSRFAICAPTAARAVQNERVHPQPSRGRFVPASHTAWEARGNPSENTTLKVRCRVMNAPPIWVGPAKFMA